MAWFTPLLVDLTGNWFVWKYTITHISPLS
jgi:hypothetical protein